MKKRGRTINAIISMFSNIILQFINIISNLILPSLFIGTFGSIINGLISSIKQIFSYVQLIGTGISEATIVSLYKPLDENNYKKISSIYNASAKTFFKTGIFFTIITLLFALIYPALVNTTLDYTSSVLLILIMGIAGASEFFIFGKYKTILIADQKVYCINVIQIITIIIILSCNLLFIKLGYNIVLVTLFSSVAYIFRTVAIFIYMKKKYNFLDKNIPADMSALSKRKAAMAHQISSLILFSSQTIIVSITCGLAEASVYSVYALIFNGLSNLLTTVSSSLLPSFGNLVFSGKKSDIKKIYEIYECIYSIMTFLLITVALLMISPFVSIYTKNITDVNYLRPELGILFSIGLLITSIRTPLYTLISAYGHYQETKWRAITEMIICLISEVVLVKIFGLPGILYGTIIAYLFSCFFVALYTNKKLLSRKMSELFKRILLNMSILIVLNYLMQFLTNNINYSSSYLSWVIIAVIVFTICFFTFLFVNAIIYKSTFYEIYTRYIKPRMERRK